MNKFKLKVIEQKINKLYERTNFMFFIEYKKNGVLNDYTLRFKYKNQGPLLYIDSLIFKDNLEENVIQYMIENSIKRVFT